jgi:hypothetical protein
LPNMCSFENLPDFPKIQGAMCKTSFVSSSTRQAPAWSSQAGALPPPARRSSHRGDLLEPLLNATTPFLSFPLSLAHFSPFRELLPETELAAMAVAFRRR